MYTFKYSIRAFSVTFLLIFFLNSPTQAQQFWAYKYENGVVVSAEEIASQIGADILKKGGNAVDAAVAVNFALAVTYPQAGNIGGGGFMMIHLANGENLALDFREEAPRDATENLLLDSQGNYSKELARKSLLSSGIPGTVDGMLEALERYGNFPLDIVMEPAIKLAENGYKLSYHQARVLNNYADVFRQYPSSGAEPGWQPDLRISHPQKLTLLRPEIFLCKKIWVKPLNGSQILAGQDFILALRQI